jgi:hypothetical protein
MGVMSATPGLRIPGALPTRTGAAWGFAAAAGSAGFAGASMFASALAPPSAGVASRGAVAVACSLGLAEAIADGGLGLLSPAAAAATALGAGVPFFAAASA